MEKLVNTNQLNSENPFIRDAAINTMAKEFFAMEHAQETKDLMFFGLLSLLLDKGIVTEDEIAAKFEESTTFYKILKARSDRQES
jgi:hypothetical protein